MTRSPTDDLITCDYNWEGNARGWIISEQRVGKQRLKAGGVSSSETNFCDYYLTVYFDLSVQSSPKRTTVLVSVQVD